MIVVALTSQDDFDASLDSIQKKGKVGFEIKDIAIEGGIPVVRAKNNPVQL